MNKLNATHSLEDHDFGELAKTESKARARTRLYILHQYRIGKQSFEIAENLSINIETVRRTRRRRRYQAFGLDSLYDKPRSGRNSKLAPEHIEAFKQLIVDTQAKRGGGRLTGQD
ncbi:helix-turn-helix domain-containing protein [Faucicola atlantae]|uniref:Uncharacterized protein n=1 Tax=Faucicola atlantae TaxID=34059 RepID=A0A1B8QKU8_9GAMM|nr:helix-turn-helix domain-containing protein [Moraxella atlantae]OBX84237.1 hypothetical protein A9306_03620 [Moraxella atlantae]